LQRAKVSAPVVTIFDSEDDAPNPKALKRKAKTLQDNESDDEPQQANEVSITVLYHVGIQYTLNPIVFVGHAT
jgi:hypothetical protein